MANNLQRLTFVFVGLLFSCSSALALDNFKEYRRDRWDFEVGTQYFYSEANYPSSGGGSQNLPSGNHYSLLDVYLGSRYTPRRNWSVFGWGNVGSAESKDSVATRSNSTITEAAVGFDFLMYSEAFQLIPEIIGVIPFEKVDPTSDTVLNSEGVIEVRSRLIAQKDFGSVRAYGWLGFTFRGDDRSYLMPWGVGTQLKLSRLRLGAELFGYQSVTDDPNKNPATRTAYINGVNAGSMKFYGVNPSLMDSQLFATWLISPNWTLQANGGMTLMGSNSAAGFHVGAFVRYSFDMTEGYTEPTYVPVDSPVPSYRSNMYDDQDEMSSERKVRQFKEQTDDGVDQNLFKPRPTKKPRVNQQQLQQQLDDTEFQIELKSNKKKRRR
ncbi:hypothetical protein QJS83_09115 [Bdellovibrio sp. 22V]|uniref:hypothetical protein n=1 Tax=Bdellovibrio TaxID=958 RepID=UPI002542D723|nr:hypothetical protein [Bdellovibrio sp. 22V]WII70616.1 hypothetical protein QJS83_09115 [Bdellovibrio sp. 22V]